jgi:hypothetical protein
MPSYTWTLALTPVLRRTCAPCILARVQCQCYDSINTNMLGLFPVANSSTNTCTYECEFLFLVIIYFITLCAIPDDKSFFSYLMQAAQYFRLAPATESPFFEWFRRTCARAHAWLCVMLLSLCCISVCAHAHTDENTVFGSRHQFTIMHWH